MTAVMMNLKNRRKVMGEIILKNCQRRKIFHLRINSALMKELIPFLKNSTMDQNQMTTLMMRAALRTGTKVTSTKRATSRPKTC